MRRFSVWFVMLCVCCAVLPAKPLALFYIANSPGSIRSFLAHEAKIDLLVPACYSVDANGLLAGAPDPPVLDGAHRDGLPAIPSWRSSARRNSTAWLASRRPEAA